MDANKIGHWVGVVVGGLVIGTLCGLVPFFVGKKRKQMTLAVGGLVACIVSGLILGLILALAVSIIFTVIIVFANPKKPEPPPVPRRW
jgi:RsiW-degrading membrane proteinase PrsW (M82 family)